MNIYRDIFWQFLLLGCTSFGGPAAHINYFNLKFVTEKKWLSKTDFSSYLALCQCLPGPSSSQLGFAIGRHRGGLFGAVCAFLGFTLPSFCLMFLLAIYAHKLSPSLLALTISALKLFAVAIVLDAVISMGKQFCTSRGLLAIALCSTLFLLFYRFAFSHVAVVAFSIFMVIALNKYHTGATAINTKMVCANKVKNPFFSIATALSFGLFLSIIFVLPIVSDASTWPRWFSQFFNAGSLVFGGGHVVLPLLEQAFISDISTDNLLMGYAGAQAMPGPIFSVAAYLGAILPSDLGSGNIDITILLSSAIMAIIAIFLPGFWLLLLTQNHWQELSTKPILAKIIATVNAAVIGMLVSAWINPIVITSIYTLPHLLIVIGAFLLIRYKKIAVHYVILFCFIGLSVATSF